MRMLRDRFGLLLIMSLAGCHADVKHGYRRGIPSMSAAGQPQFSMEQVRTASFRPGLPPHRAGSSSSGTLAASDGLRRLVD